MIYNARRSHSKEIIKNTGKDLITCGNGYPKERILNLQKREKLKGLLLAKFLKKYGYSAPENLIKEELSRFLQCEKVNDKDLKNLEKKIDNLIKEKYSQETLKRNLSQDPQSIHHTDHVKNTNALLQSQATESSPLPDLNQMETRSIHSRMSGASNLSKFNEKGIADKIAQDEIEDFHRLSHSNQHTDRIDFSHEGDEWNAICKYNRKLFEQEKVLNNLKDMEIKRRAREDLDNQVKQKVKRLYVEHLKNNEHDEILLKHMQYLGEIEHQKEVERKKRILQEKESRDLQLKDDRRRKRAEIIKEKKYEKELIKHLNEEIDKEKKIILKKKIEEHEALKKTLKDNELNKLNQLEAIRREKEDDIKACEEYAKVLERQENERREYFKKIERNSNNFLTQSSNGILKDMERGNKEEEERMRAYLAEKERLEQEEEEKKKQQVYMNKKILKNFLDQQVEEKRKLQQFDKVLDAEQAKIWKTDTQRYYDQEKDIRGQIKLMHIHNLNYVKTQLENKKNNVNSKMTDAEYAMNKQLLEKLASTS